MTENVASACWHAFGISWGNAVRLRGCARGRVRAPMGDVPDLVAYLKCDARASDAQRQMMIEKLAACVVSLGR